VLLADRPAPSAGACVCSGAADSPGQPLYLALLNLRI
jgi:hypothetical protein